MTDRRLRKGSTEKMIAGVCGGLGRYLDVDPTWVRLVFVLLVFAGGLGLLAYIVLAIIMPADQTLVTGTEETLAAPTTAAPITPEADEQHRRRQVEIVGLILVLVGILFLASNFGLFSWWRWDVLWPMVLIRGGVFLIIRRSNR